MKRDQTVLDQPAERLFRRVALGLLEDAAKACDRLGGDGDAESLHDFRVNVRRLRGYLNCYRGHIGKDALGRLPRRLRKLTKATNTGRDLHVHVQWLMQQLQQGHLSRAQQSGVRLMLDELEERQHAEKDAAPPRLGRDFRAAAFKLQRRLRRVTLKRGRGGTVPSYAAITAQVLADQAARLRGELGALEVQGDVETVHAPRLTVKRIRYLLEPISARLPHARRAVRQLRRVQDLLGTLHDLQMLEAQVSGAVEKAARDWARQLVRQAAAQPGRQLGRDATRPVPACSTLTAVVQRLRREQDRRLAILRRQYLGPKTDVWLAPLDDLAAALAARASTSQTHTASMPPDASPVIPPDARQDPRSTPEVVTIPSPLDLWSKTPSGRG